jgi:hypothetical protein
MTHNIIKTDNYLFIGSDDDIRRGLFYCVRRKNIFQDEGEDIHCCMGDIRIIAHLPLNNSPVLEGIDLLPALEDGVEKLAEEFKSSYKKVGVTDYEVSSFIVGYNKAKEKYKYTEEDLREALFEVLNTSKEECCATHTKDSIVRRVIKSLQQPKIPDAFECEMVTMNKGYTEESDYPYQQCDIPKITTNSQGLTQWVGSYIFKTKNQN